MRDNSRGENIGYKVDAVNQCGKMDEQLLDKADKAWDVR